MNFKAVLGMLMLVWIAGLISAADSVSFQVFETSVIAEYNLENVSNLELKIPYDAQAVESNIQNYIINEADGYKIIEVASASKFTLKYVTKSMIEKSSGNYYFIYKNQLNKKVDATLYLEEFYGLVKDGLLFPADAQIDSDGRRIILTWKNFDKGQIVVNYEKPGKSNFWFYIVFGVLILAFVLHYFFSKKQIKEEVKKVREQVKAKKTKEIVKEEITKNLFEDEKKIVEYILGKEKRECWTKEILKDLGITKVKLSRKLRSLEQKEIIKRLPYGNENKIRLVGGK